MRRSSAVDRLDAAVDRVFDRHLRGRPAIDRVFYSASALGDYSLIWLLLGAARGLRSDRDTDAAIRLGVCLGIESAVVNQGIKRLVPRNRPVPRIPRPLRLRTPRTTSFPSGHASAGFTAATLFVDSGGSPAVWYPLAALVGLSRVHVSIHHASDVVAGAVVGLAFGRLATRLWPLPAPEDRDPGPALP